jgi:xanthine dehydrogenase YagS FAD-binding subunit
MKPFAYSRAGSVAEAVAADAVYLGGGTNLVDLMRLGVERPQRLVDVSRLPADPRVPDVLREAILAGASGQVRNLATVAGNLLQRTRCSYFQDVTKACNKRAPGSGCPAVEGEHHNLAILGHSPACVATHPSDMAVALVALDALVETDRRALPVRELHRLPGDEPQRDTVLEPGELITAVVVPPATGGRSVKVRERASFSFALVSIAALADPWRIALGGVAHRPWRCVAAEAALRDGASFAEAADAELSSAEPLRDNAFKVKLARNLIIRTLEEL